MYVAFVILIVSYVVGVLVWAAIWVMTAFDEWGEDKVMAYRMLFSTIIWPLALVKIIRDDYLEALEDSRDR